MAALCILVGLALCALGAPLLMVGAFGPAAVVAGMAGVCFWRANYWWKEAR